MMYLLGIKKRRGKLIYPGVHKGLSLLKIFFKYVKCYAFKANPEIFKKIPKIIKLFPGVNIYNKAIANSNGNLKFNISSNDGASSSLSKFDKNWNNSSIQMIKTIEVEAIKLSDFFEKNKIFDVDDYVSDFQGYDLVVLKTLKDLIDQKKIKTITCETLKTNKQKIYGEAPDNSFEGFNQLLSKNYKYIASGWSNLKEVVFKETHANWIEMDCKWVLKK